MLLGNEGEIVMIAVKLTKGFIVHDCADLDAHTDMVMEALIALESESVADSDMDVTLTTGEVTISVVGISGRLEDAMAIADSAIRTAIHASNGSTPDWQEVSSESLRLVSV